MQRASAFPFLLSPVSHAVLSLLSFAALGMAHGAHAQTIATGAPLSLTLSPMLTEASPEEPGNELPTFAFGDRISGRQDLETLIDGNAELRRGAKTIKADRIDYAQPEDTVKALGKVRINRAGNQFAGPELQIKLDSFEGYFKSPTYRFLSNGGNGQAERIDFIDKDHLVAHKATFTTCERDNEASWKPAWVLTGDNFKFDQQAETGEANGAVLRFKGVPILAFPKVSFPLSDKRKSGFLPPTFNVDSTSGVMLSQPYYLNIAPNRDATFTPTLMSKRGVALASEFRYLEPDYSGRLRTNLMPSDKLRQETRWSYGYEHADSIATGLPAIGSLGLKLDLNRVSDNNYWRDFPRSSTSLTDRLLSSEAVVSWSRGYFSSSLRTLKWQTLQDPSAPITPPYDRLPQLTAAYSRVNVPLAGSQGFDWSVEGDYTRFSANRSLTLQPNSDRIIGRAQISRPWVTPGWFITPKLQLKAASYRFDDALANGQRAASYVLPTFSMDSGLQFERSTQLFGRSLTQTLEPRAFYVRTPYRDQRLLPNYDSGANDFNFATVFTENAFTGNDRVSDANLLTLGVSSRLLEPNTGAELAHFGIAQRVRFEDQRVTLPGVLPVSDRISDLLVGSSINWAPEWAVDSTLQYNFKTNQSTRSTLGMRYTPSAYRVISASMKRQRDVSNLVDVGWQWPLNDLWGDKGKNSGSGQGQGGGRFYSVGRLNYSVPDRKLVDTVMGVEYDGCCWIGRVVVQRSQTSTTASNTRILFQLELVGFSRIGSNPLQILKTQIPRYQYLRDQVSSPSRFTQYD